MEIKITYEQAIIAASSLFVGSLIGALCQHSYHKKHTPESKIKELNNAREAYERSKREAEKEAYDARRAYSELAGRKKAYQDEIRPAIESKIREELQTYIAQAEKTYMQAKKEREDAKHDKEIANLKLELAKTLSENTKETVKEKIIIKASDDKED